MYSQPCLIKITSIPLTRTLGHDYLLEKTIPAWAFPHFPWEHPRAAVGSAPHWPQRHLGQLVAFWSPLYPKSTWPQHGGGIHALREGSNTIASKGVEEHPMWVSHASTISTREAPPSFPRCSLLPAELRQDKNVMCFAAGGTAN